MNRQYSLALVVSVLLTTLVIALMAYCNAGGAALAPSQEQLPSQAEPLDFDQVSTRDSNASFDPPTPVPAISRPARETVFYIPGAEYDEPPDGTGTIRIVTLYDGNEVLGIPFRVWQVVDWGAASARIKSGETLRAPNGDYRVQMRWQPWMDPLTGAYFEEPPFQLSVGDTKVITFELPWPLCRVRIAPGFAREVELTGVIISAQHLQMGASSLNRSWNQESKPIIYWCPPGEVSIEADAHGYEKVSTVLSLTAENAAKETVVNLTLEKEK